MGSCREFFTVYVFIRVTEIYMLTSFLILVIFYYRGEMRIWVPTEGAYSRGK